MFESKECDQWGNGLRTLAARINELLSLGLFRSVKDIYDILVNEFPTTTLGRVRQHCRWLRINHPLRLSESDDGRFKAYKLV